MNAKELYTAARVLQTLREKRAYTQVQFPNTQKYDPDYIEYDKYLNPRKPYDASSPDWLDNHFNSMKSKYTPVPSIPFPSLVSTPINYGVSQYNRYNQYETDKENYAVDQDIYRFNKLSYKDNLRIRNKALDSWFTGKNPLLRQNSQTWTPEQTEHYRRDIEPYFNMPEKPLPPKRPASLNTSNRDFYNNVNRIKAPVVNEARSLYNQAKRYNEERQFDLFPSSSVPLHRPMPKPSFSNYPKVTPPMVPINH